MPAAPAAPPPSKPSAAAPASPPPVKPAGVDILPAPASSADKMHSDYMGDAMAELEAMTADPVPEQKSGPKKDPVTGKFTKPEPKPEPETKEDETEVQPELPVKPEAKKVEEPRAGSMRALGKAYDELKKERDTVWHPKVQKLEAELNELRNKPAPDNTQVTQRMTQMEKENAALREEIRYVNYQKHPEFAEKYEKPYNEAWTKAVSEVTQLSMETEDGSRRKATSNDLLALANAPLDQIDDLAEKWFGKSAPRVIRHIEKVRDLADAQQHALAEAKKGAGDREKQMMEQAQKQNESVAKAYSETNTELTKKYPNWFAPIEGDEAGTTALNKGYEYADSVFGGNGNLTPEQKVKRLAIIRGKAANHDRLAIQLKARNARIAELEASLAEYEKSTPPTTEGAEPGGDSVNGDDWKDEIARLAK